MFRHINKKYKTMNLIKSNINKNSTKSKINLDNFTM